MMVLLLPARHAQRCWGSGGWVRDGLLCWGVLILAGQMRQRGSGDAHPLLPSAAFVMNMRITYPERRAHGLGGEVLLSFMVHIAMSGVYYDGRSY